ncbi:MAG: DnaJ C-terminal domain-containing protein [Pseudomonadota bacterium]
MSDPYDILGVDRAASADALKKAYRKLAKTYHPDLSPGDAAVEKKFKEISAAYDFLSDPARRARYDRGEIGADGSPRASWTGPTGRASAGGARRSAGGGMGGFGFKRPFGGGRGAEDLFAELFGHEGVRGGSAKLKGDDFRLDAAISLADAAKGAKARVKTPDGRMLDVAIPAGVQDGQTLRLKGQGQPGIGGADPGDALITVRIKADKIFTLQGADVHLELPISLVEAVEGAKVSAPTVDGAVALTVPAGSSSGVTLRLKGKGLPKPGGGKGDQYVKLMITLPDRMDDALKRFAKDWRVGRAHDPRSSKFEAA